MAIIISEKDRNYIKSIIGAPNISLEDTGVLTEEILDDYIIEPSLIEYFRWFPVEQITQTTLSSSATKTQVLFPTDREIDGIFTFDLLDCRLAEQQDINLYSGNSSFTNPIVQFRNISQSSSSSRLGSKFDYGFKEIQGSLNFANDSIANLNKVFYNKVDYQNKLVDVFSSNAGIVQCTFAQYSNNVDHVKYTSKREFLDLCRGELLLYWANVLKRVNPDFPVAFNVDDLVSDGQDLIDKTIEKWQGKSKSILIRG